MLTDSPARRRFLPPDDRAIPDCENFSNRILIMSEIVAQMGAVLSADIAVPQHDVVVRFYSRVLGTGETPLWREDLMNNLGIPVIGVGERIPEYAHLPVQWMPHIQVDDVAASVRTAIRLGAEELMHAKDEDGSSQWAVLLDPGGAAFGLIPTIPAEAIPPVPDDIPPAGRIAWVDLTLSDAPSRRDFYREVVGWSVQEVAMTDGEDRYSDFNMLAANGTPAAGVCHARGQNRDLPSVWLIYLPVGDLAESIRRVTEEGGEVVKSVRGRDGEYVYAAIRDPAGAYFALAPA